MFPVPQRASVFHGIGFCLLLSVGFCFSLPGVVDLSQQPQLKEQWLAGDLGQVVEAKIDQHSPLRQRALRWWSNLQYLLFKEGLAGVVLGKQGWLYSVEEFRSPADLARRIDYHSELILDVEQQLSKQGIELWILLVPMKLAVYPEFAPAESSVLTQDLCQQLQQRLLARQLKVIAIEDAMVKGKAQGQVYLPRDTHWSPLGAKLAAQALADNTPELRGKDRFRTEAVGSSSHQGDLINFLQFEAKLAPDYFAMTEYTKFQTLPAGDTEPVSALQLFGEDDASLQLVGTSYSFLEYLNFAGWLKAFLQRDMLVTAIPGNGAYFAMQRFWFEQQQNPAPVSQVIWEFPVRTLLRQGDDRYWQVKTP